MTKEQIKMVWTCNVRAEQRVTKKLLFTKNGGETIQEKDPKPDEYIIF